MPYFLDFQSEWIILFSGWNNVSMDEWNWITYWMETPRVDGISFIGFDMEYQNVLYWIVSVVWMVFGIGWNV